MENSAAEALMLPDPAAGQEERAEALELAPDNLYYTVFIPNFSRKTPDFSPNPKPQ